MKSANTDSQIQQHNPLYQIVATRISKTLAAIYQDIKELQSEEELTQQVYLQLSPAPDSKLGDIAFACFQWAKKLKKSPAQIASELAVHPKLITDGDHYLEKASATGPYLNFTLKNQAIGGHIIAAILKSDFFNISLLKNTATTMLEYSQPNTHKVLHVGHMRNLCLGNALANILRYSGHHVITSTYPGDVGTHVAKCLWYLKENKLTPPSEQNKGAWLGEIYTLAHHQLEDEKGSDKEQRNREQLTAVLKQLHAENGEYYQLWQETREWSIELMKNVYQWADVEFDRWYFESEVDAPSLSYAQKLYQEGKLIKDQGAIGMDLSDEKLGFCLLIKSDGTGLYATKDIELARKKFDEYNIQKSISIVDNRQTFHFKQVFKILEKLGFEYAQDCYHLPYDVVELPDGAMSSRKGNIIPLMDLIVKMEQTITEQYLEKYRNIWSDEEIKKTATQIANGAIKYGMIRMDNNRKIVFDFDEWLRLDGETGPYLQYVYARIQSLCQKANYDPVSANLEEQEWEELKIDIEHQLMVKLMEFNQVTLSCALNLKTLHLTSYLYELGKMFNQFYTQCPINSLENQKLKELRLHLTWATGEVMKKGLTLLGIPAVSKM